MSRILSRGILIGESRFERTDPSMGILNRAFVPSDSCTPVQQIFLDLRSGTTDFKNGIDSDFNLCHSAQIKD